MTRLKCTRLIFEKYDRVVTVEYEHVTGLTKIKDGELVDNDCRLSIFYDDKKIEVMYKSDILGVTGTATITA